ncbi:MAG: family 10 glycosylhydrolase [Planctomycetes bacterium]|nr:family 10 glycosylhydrolase [Planctomycetota bacterium]MCW8136146.1 family 10 glycosylhydrolase [Planctomycetota bacterium]
MIRLILLLALAALPLAAQIIDNGGAGYSEPSGSWTTGTSATDKYGADYRFASTVGTAGPATAAAEWRPTLAAGQYTVSVWYPQGTNRANDAPFRVYHNTGTALVRVNQTAGGGGWVVLGTYDFAAGTGGYVTLSNDAESGKVVLADAVRFETYTTPPMGSPEFRGVWVSRFEWPSTTPATWKSNINNIMANAKAGNFNAVVLQMRGTTETLYPSPNEPLSPLIALNPGDDPLQYAINAAHAQGLQLHCYFNTHVCTAGFASANPGWVIADSGGTTQGAPVDGYYWLAPGHPDVQQYLRTQVMHIVNNYPQLDGIHFDRIRMPEAGYSYDTTSNARRAGRGNPDSLAFGPWTADQITRWLRDVYAQVHSVNPRLQLSAAPLGLYHWTAYSGYPTGYYYGLPRHQDAKAWMAQGALDWIAPQIYWPDGGGLPDFSDLAPDWQAARNGRHIYPGMSASSDSSAAETIAEINASRSFGCAGTMVWSYGSANSLNFWSALTASGAPYQTAAPAPTLDWLENPTKAIVYGYVSNSAGASVQDAWVNVNGQSYTAVSAKDGFWCWLELTPGTYVFTANDPTHGSATLMVQNLQAGEVRRVDLRLGPAGTAVRLEADPPMVAYAGHGFNVPVRVADSAGNTVGAGSYTVDATYTAAAGTLTGAMQQVTGSGTAAFNFTFSDPGVVFITFSTAGLTGTTIAVTVSTGSPGGGGGGKGGKDSGGGGCSLGARAPWQLLLFTPLLLLWRRRARAGCLVLANNPPVARP